MANTIFTMETDFAEKLKELQRNSEQMEKDIVECKEQKNQLLEDILEAERQVMLWEKKILLEKETQEALDPEYGQAEVAGAWRLFSVWFFSTQLQVSLKILLQFETGMKKEIHRMELRLRQLTTKQEEMMQEMERAIEKKSAIETKYVELDSTDPSRQHLLTDS